VHVRSKLSQWRKLNLLRPLAMSVGNRECCFRDLLSH
jgi:hypothetical protein